MENSRLLQSHAFTVNLYFGWCLNSPIVVIHKSMRGDTGHVVLCYVYEDRLVLFRDEESFDTFHTFLGHVPNKYSVNVEFSIFILALFNACIFTSKTLIYVRDTSGPKKEYISDKFCSML